MLRKVLSVIAGVAVAMAVIFLLEAITGKIYPPPPGTDFNNPETLKHLLDTAPHAVFLLLLTGYAVGSLAGGITATIASKCANMRPALIVGAIVMAGGIMDIVQIHHPVWFAIASLATYIPFALLGYILVRKMVASHIS